jgi:glycosyltransferase involved in cell wall biosynthesis
MTDRVVSRQRRLTVLSLVGNLSMMGGGERFVRELMINLDPDRFDRIFCATRWEPEAERGLRVDSALDELRDAGVEFVGLERSSKADLTAWVPLVRLMQRRSVDVVHSHMFGSNVWGAVLTKTMGTPVFVAHEQTWSYEGKPLRRLLDRELIARAADAFIAVSTADRRRMIDVEGISADKIIYIPNAVPTPSSGAALTDVRQELGIPPDQPVVGTVAVLRPQKALEVLLEAAPDILEQFPDATIVIAGDGPEKAKLERLRRELNLSDRVRMLGARTDVASVLGAFDVCVSTSDFEGTPLALMEAMEAGVPIVATRVGGTPDLIDDGVHGLLVEPREPRAVAAAVNALLADRDRATAMARAAQQRRRSEFEITQTARRIGELYEELYARATAERR